MPRASRDVVLIDQRGTGGSAALHCDREGRRAVWDDKFDPAAVESCRKALERHADLAQYSTENAAADVDDVRAALRYERIDLWGLSYGTELAQVYMKRYPSRARSAVLSGMVTIQLRRGPFGELVRNMLGSASGQRAVPALIHAAAGGDFTGFVATDAGASAPVAEGLYLSVVCSEAQPRIPADVTPYTNGTFLGSYRVDQERAACARWTRHQVASSFYTPLADSDIQMLVVSGSMDHVATPDWGWEFCRTMTKCTFVRIPEMGHSSFDLGRWTSGAGCVDRVYRPQH